VSSILPLSEAILKCEDSLKCLPSFHYSQWRFFVLVVDTNGSELISPQTFS